MIGKINGMTAILRNKLRKKSIISHHCMAHRLEIAFGHSMKKFPVFVKLEEDMNKLYGYFHHSDKRYAILDKFLTDKGKKTFRFQKVFKVRYVEYSYNIFVFY